MGLYRNSWRFDGVGSRGSVGVVCSKVSEEWLPRISVEKEVAHILRAVVGGSFFFWAIHDISSFGPYALEYTEDAMGLIAALFDLVAGAVLAFLGWKLLKAKEPSS